MMTGLYESSRAVTTVDGLPRASSVKAAADVLQKERRAVVSPQTCDKSKMRILEVNFCETKKC